MSKKACLRSRLRVVQSSDLLELFSSLPTTSPTIDYCTSFQSKLLLSFFFIHYNGRKRARFEVFSWEWLFMLSFVRLHRVRACSVINLSNYNLINNASKKEYTSNDVRCEAPSASSTKQEWQCCVYISCNTGK